MRIPTLLVPLISVAALLLVGCRAPRVGAEKEEDRTIPVGKAEIVRAVLEMKAGQLRLQGGATSLLDAHFRYAHDHWRPQLRYEETGFRGNLHINQPKVTFGVNQSGESPNEWDLRLNDRVPLALEVGLGAGESILDLRGLNLRSVQVRMGAGRSELNLAGEWNRSFEASIRGGVGQITVRLPRNIGVEAVAQGGIGEIRARGFRQSGNRYTNQAAEDGPAIIRLDIRGGIGQIVLDMGA